MNVFRLTVVMPLAAIITLGLFAMMSSFIRQDGPTLDPAKPVPSLVITAKIKDSEVTPPQLPPKPLSDEPPKTEIEFPRADKPGSVPFDPPAPAPTGPTDFRYGSSGYSGPIIRPRPVYPQRCLAHGTEGRVYVQFDVTPEGNVVNPRIIDSPDSCFNREVIRTVSGWKYAPATDSEGHPVMRYDVVEVVSFEIEE